MRKLWYNFIRIYVKIGLFFLFKRMSVYGKENIPKNGAVIFIGNHQNALIDAIVVPTTNNRNSHFLTRASAFKVGLVAQILRSLNMIPIYRVRDGVRTIEKNFAVFEQCIEILKEKKAIQIFAEGEHHLDRRVQSLKKGFARIILGTLQKYPDLPIYIVPIGINYDSHLNFPSSTSIYYGRPILANQFIDVKKPDTKFKEITNQVSIALKNLTLHVDDSANYAEIIVKLETMGVDYLNPFEANKMVENIDTIPSTAMAKKEIINLFTPFHLLAKLNSVFPLLIWKYIKPNIKDVVFMNTYRFALITTLFPLFYIIQAAIVYYIFNWKLTIIYLFSSIFLGIISTKTMTISQ
ncbi:MAG: lysophospholipid acyltransferase family protein [Lutibacter sp.]|nr:lysophospholipid acyltransferase family protein [Lutibacter sp.]